MGGEVGVMRPRCASTRRREDISGCCGQVEGCENPSRRQAGTGKLSVGRIPSAPRTARAVGYGARVLSRKCRTAGVGGEPTGAAPFQRNCRRGRRHGAGVIGEKRPGVRSFLAAVPDLEERRRWPRLGAIDVDLMAQTVCRRGRAGTPRRMCRVPPSRSPCSRCRRPPVASRVVRRTRVRAR